MAHAPVFEGEVDEMGTLLIFDLDRYQRYLTNTLRGGRVFITVERDTLPAAIRSLDSNSRYWTVLVPLAMHRLNLDREVPLNKKQVFEVLVVAFAGYDDEEPTELGPVRARTSRMTQAQFNHLTEQTELWLREKGYPIPQGPEETVAWAIAEATA